MLPQQDLIARVVDACTADARVAAAFMYGSFAKGEGDRYSDVEFWLYFDAAPPDPGAWLARVAPLRGHFANEFGTQVALFDGGVRGEFHLVPAARLAELRSLAGSAEPDGLRVVVDRTGELTEIVADLARQPLRRSEPAQVQALYDGFLHWWLLGRAVLARGEYARALDALSALQRYLCWLARLVEQREARHWLTPSRALEAELSPAVYARLRACSAPLEPAALERAYREVGVWARELADALAARAGLDPRTALRDGPAWPGDSAG